MRLFEAILDANHRALAGDTNAGLHPADFESELPIAALTCIDPRLNKLLPAVLGVPEEHFIWLRNAGNILTNPLSSTTWYFAPQASGITKKIPSGYAFAPKTTQKSSGRSKKTLVASWIASSMRLK